MDPEIERMLRRIACFQRKIASFRKSIAEFKVYRRQLNKLEKQELEVRQGNEIYSLRLKNVPWDEVQKIMGISAYKCHALHSEAKYRNKRNISLNLQNLNHDDPLDRLCLSVRLSNILRDIGIKTIGELIEMDRNTLWHYRGMGRIMLAELYDAVTRTGTSWDNFNK